MTDEWNDKKKKKPGFNIDEWETCIETVPLQNNGYDCGVFVCKFAEFICEQLPFKFDQKNMPYFRRRMVAEILRGELLE